MMDNINNNNFSGESILVEINSVSSSNSDSQQHRQQQQPQPKLISPSRQRAIRFLHSISKRLGRRGTIQRQLVYNSQDDVRSSSTDSFSLSLDRGEKHLLSSSIDLTSSDGGHSSRASDSSGTSSGNDENHLTVNKCTMAFQQRPHRHSYELSCYRSVSALGNAHDANDADDDDSDTGDDNDNDHSSDDHETTAHLTHPVYKFCTRSPLKGLHFNRINISTVSRVLQHISSSSSSSASASTRSLSCNSTPLKRNQQQQQEAKKDKKATAANAKSGESKEAAKQSQQKRILRQPINYVYLKGMSGLPTRRVPRSSLCCSYAYR